MKAPVVETENCISCGLCVSACSAVFRFDNAGKAECFDATGATESEIQSAIDGCPVQCIIWK